jgi:hypothetical protein
MTDYITKPISRHSLWRMLQRHAVSSRTVPSPARPDFRHLSRIKTARVRNGTVDRYGSFVRFGEKFVHCSKVWAGGVR